jgi:hypothetical protein
MTRQLVVVVHGVGVRQAGVTTDIIASALVADPATQAPLRPVSTDDLHLFESPRYSRGGLRSTFPARLRRYRRRAADGTDADQRVVADFYWGDIAATGDDAPRLALGFLRIVLGLAHVIREAGCEVFATDRPADRAWRRVAVAAPLILHGPILAINLVLVLGVLADLLARLVPGAPLSPALGAGLVGVLALALAAWRGPRAAAWLERWFWAWTAVIGLAVLALAGLAAGGGWPGSRLDQALALIGLMMAGWAVAVVASLVTGAAAWWRPPRAAAGALLVPSFALMMCLWFLIISAVWAAILSSAAAWTGQPLPQDERALIEGALAGILPALVTLVGLGLAGLGLHGAKGRALRAVPPDSYGGRQADLARMAARWRLIVAPMLRLILWLFLLATIALVLALWVWPDLQADLVPWVGWALAALAAALGGVIVWFRLPLAMGLAIVTDIVLWLNDYSWRLEARDTAPHTFRRRTPPGEAALAELPPDDPTPRGYWLRQRIRERFRVLMTTLLRDEDPDRIVIIAHSQGTVIAMDVIRHDGRDWRARAGQGQPPRDLRLVTMGSPARHLYHHHFPVAFPAPEGVAELAPLDRGGLMSDWVNIFRIDDFVGTRIGPPPAPHGPGSAADWPLEYPVPPRGHTSYGLDDAVLDRLRAALDF